PKLSRADATIDFHATAQEVRGRIHGLTPWPGVRVQWHAAATGKTHELILRRVKDEPQVPHNAEPGTVLDHWRIATGQGVIELLQVQPPGKGVMSINDFARGHAVAPGDRLTSM